MKSKDELRKINVEDNLAQLFLLCEGVYLISTGFLLFTLTNASSNRGIYNMLSNLMSLDAWSVIFFISGVLLIVSSFQKGSLRSLFILIGGFLGGILLVLYGVAYYDLDNGTDIALGIRYVIVGSFCLVASGLGGREFWVSRMIKKR